MTIDQGIQFGDVEHVPPAVRLRPDCDKHYAVEAVGAPSEADLPIFVDVDVMREMEEHAQSDTTVELGGVLLGGQYHDANGAPFVVVTDSLRAQHFEATKGSFKFTHETWTEISRERDGFGEHLQMVGWYHTHPGWGVFLSHMDTFICDNFFNKPLDVALVIDPCQDERGWFQWTGGATRQLRRTGGFYVTASRFRWEELEYCASLWEGESAMSTQSRSHGMSRMPAAGRVSYPAPVVNISENRNSWQGIAVLGMMTMQFLLLMVLAWRLLPPGGDEAITSSDVAAVEKKVDKLLAEREAADRARVQNEVLESVVAAMSDSPPGLVGKLEAEAERANKLEALVDASVLAQRQHVALRESLESDLDNARREKASTERTLENVRKSRDKIRDDKDAEIARLQEELAALKPPEDGESAGGVFSIFSGRTAIWMWVGVVGLAVLIGGAGMALVAIRRRNIEASLKESDEAEGDEPYSDQPPSGSTPGSSEDIGP